MEFQFLSAFLILTLFFISLRFIILNKKPKDNRPPGPKQLPIIGHLHHLLASHDLPHKILRDLSKKHGPLMYLQLGQVPYIVVSSPDAAKQVLKTHDLAFSDRPVAFAADILFYNARDLAFSRFGDYWKQIRKLYTLELLSTKRVLSYKSIREEEVANLVRSISSSSSRNESVNLSKMIESMSYYIVSRAALGLSYKQHDSFIPLIQNMIEVLAGFSIADFFPSLKLLCIPYKSKLMKLHREVDVILDNIIKEHKSNRANAAKIGSKDEPDDFVDVLLNLQEHGDLEFPLTTTHIKAIVMEVLLTGTDTSATVIIWAMSEMLRNPSVLTKAQAEVRQVGSKYEIIDGTIVQDLKYLQSVINESLGMHPPPTLIPRASREKVEIYGYQIPENTNVFINSWAIGRDPGFWVEPEIFNPDRFSNSTVNYKGSDFHLIPFGNGRRICPGMLFGMLSVELTLANLLYHFDWELPNGAKPEELDMSEALGIIIRRKNDLCLTLTSYNSCLAT